MENFIRKISITFIICMFAIILIFIGINYQSNEEVKNLKEDNIGQKDENKNEISKEKEEGIDNKEKKDSKQQNDLNNKSDVNKSIENNKNNIDDNDYGNDFKLNDSNVYSSYNQQPYIQIEKFSARINNNRLYIGETININTEIYPEDATEKNIAYTSSNKNIAIVSKSGIITGVNVGDCEITISVNNSLSGKLKIHVLPSNNTIYKDIDDKETATVESTVEYAPQNIITNKDKIQENDKYDTKGNVDGSNDINQSITQDSNTNISNKNIDNNVKSITNDEVKSYNDNQGSQKEVQIPNNIPNEDKKQQESNQSSTPQTQKSEEKIKDGWITENGKKYYYKNNKKLKDTYVDYIYLNSKGIAQDKIGNFSATLYGATAWANQKLNMRKTNTNSSEVIKIIPVGGKMKILSSDDSSSKYIKVKYGDKEGYVYSDYIYINLPDVIPDAIYEITNANKSIFKSADKNISGVTGKNLYGFSKKKNEKIGKSTYYAPLLYPVAKQLQKAYNIAQKEGYNLKIYDTYRPYSVTQDVNVKFKNLYNSSKKVKQAVDHDKDGSYWGPSWFLASSISRHNRGVALDLALTDKNGKELSAQSKMHTLDTRSVRKYNNNNAKKLSKIMTSAGFETLDSEWWHFQEDNYKNSPYTTFKIS